MNTPTVRADPNFYRFHRDNADFHFDFHIDLPEHDKFKFECVTQYDGISAVVMVKSNSIGCDNMHPKFIRIILPMILSSMIHLFHTIIMSGMYPIKWKHAKIVPVRKSNGDYRPIAILCFISKVLEKILYMKMMNYIQWRAEVSACSRH